MTDSESNSEDDKTELSSSDSEIDSTEGNSTQAELSDDSVREFNGFSSLFNEQEGSGLVEDDASDSDDDQESSGYDSNSGDNKIKLRLSDSESADENTDPAATESVRSDESECQLLDGLSSLFGDRGESNLGEDDKFDSDDDQESSKDESNDEDNINMELRLSDSESADDNAEPTAAEHVMSDNSVHELLGGRSSLFDAQGESDLGDDDCMGDNSLCLLDAVSTLFEEHKECEYGDFPDDVESPVGMLESTPKDKQEEPIVQNTPKTGHWETAIRSLKIAAGVAGVGLALYAAYKYFRWLWKSVDTVSIKLCALI